MSKETKPTKKKKESVAIMVRVRPGAAEWLESQTDQDRPTRQDVVREMIDEKRRATPKK